MTESTEQHGHGPPHSELRTVDMPRPTVAPMMLALGLVLLAAGVALGTALLVVGFLIFVLGLSTWVASLLPGRGHFHEPLVEPEQRPQPIAGVPGSVEQLRVGGIGYRLQLPQKVRPVSAGIRGGIVGGLVMPLPALAYGLTSGHGIWYPINLLAGVVLPGIGESSVADLEQFHRGLFIAGLIFHGAFSVFFGLMYGVLLPMLPDIPKPLAWGGLLMPLLWTAASFSLLGLVNPVLQKGIDWPWFIASQFVFGVVSALVVIRAEGLPRILAGILGGLAGGLLMPLPALLWSLATGHGIWYPMNLLAGMILPGIDQRPIGELYQFHAMWLGAAVAIHATFSLAFGLAYGLVLPLVGPIPGPFAWGGLLMPLLWTGVSYSLMGVVNPLLQERVNWPWFIASQFVFGVAAAIIVVRTEEIQIPPAGHGPDA